MNKVTNRLNRLSLPVTILIASIIVGSFIYASQVYKQQSIAKQQQIELQAKAEQEQRAIEQDKQERLDRDLKEQKAKNADRLDLDFCISQAEGKYKKSAQYWLDAESKIGADNVIDAVAKEKLVLQEDKDECFKRYPQK